MTTVDLKPAKGVTSLAADPASYFLGRLTGKKGQSIPQGVDRARFACALVERSDPKFYPAGRAGLGRDGCQITPSPSWGTWGWPPCVRSTSHIHGLDYLGASCLTDGGMP